MPHLDEGTIHAWLDGALPDAEAVQVEAHVRECAACADAVAEARGFIAATSRILSALDDVPGGVVPVPRDEASVVETPADPPSLRLERRETARPRPWLRGRSYAIAAMLVMAVGTALVLRQRPSETVATANQAVPRAFDSVNAPAPPMVAAAPAEERARSTGDDRAPRPAAGPVRSEPQPSPLPASPSASGVSTRIAQEAAARRDAEKKEAPAADRPESPKVVGAVARITDSLRPATRLAFDSSGFRSNFAQRAGTADSLVPPRVAAPAPVAALPRAAVDSIALASKSAAGGGAVNEVARQLDLKTGDSLRVISGRVFVTGTGAPVLQANVLVRGFAIGVVTDARGEFRIRAPRRDVTIEVRAIGYAAATRVMPADRDTLTVGMAESTLALSEVVTTGASAEQSRRRAGAAPPLGGLTVTTCYQLVFPVRDVGSGTDDRSRLPARFQLDTTTLVTASGRSVRRLIELTDASRPAATGVWYARGDVAELAWQTGAAASLRLEIATGAAPISVRSLVDSANQTRSTPIATARRITCPAPR